MCIPQVCPGCDSPFIGECDGWVAYDCCTQYRISDNLVMKSECCKDRRIKKLETQNQQLRDHIVILIQTGEVLYESNANKTKLPMGALTAWTIAYIAASKFLHGQKENKEKENDTQ